MIIINDTMCINNHRTHEPPIKTESIDGHNNEKPVLTSPEDMTFLNKTQVKVNHLLDAQEKYSAELTSVSVKLARKQFIINTIDVIVASITFSITAVVAVGSGGLAIPIAVFAGLNLMSSLSNLACASYNWNCVSKNKEELAMGNDGLQQAIFYLAKYCQASDSNAKIISRYAAPIIKIGITATMAVIGATAHLVIKDGACLLAEHYAPILTSILSAFALNFLGSWINNYTDEMNDISMKLSQNEKDVISHLVLLEGMFNVLTGREGKMTLSEHNRCQCY
ncbi:hypothetical protein [Yersinia aleksiciae]|uniref:hypothetical protein n=1 Tax=Yersinia aleksiciae TaxID=263819 RepID=UPI0011AA64EA|nr:hypothetical protein [Yersinia aleksiciae]